MRCGFVFLSAILQCFLFRIAGRTVFQIISVEKTPTSASGE